MNSQTQQVATLGADIRALRKARGLTLTEIATRLDRSVGWFSQVERDMSEPSISDLRLIAECLGVPMSMLFAHSAVPADEQGYVVRAGSRRPMGSGAEGLIEELLSPDLTDDFQVIHSVFEPGASRLEKIERPTQELGYAITGKLDIWLDEDKFTIHPGDSFRVRDHGLRWANPYREPAVLIWVMWGQTLRISWTVWIGSPHSMTKCAAPG